MTASLVGLVSLALARYAGALLIVQAPIRDPDAIVMLASHEWERLPATIRLASQAPAAHVLLTVPPIVTEHNCVECGTRVATLIAGGISRARITVLSEPVRNTLEEARGTLAYCRGHRVRSILIVTSPYHTRRALATFRHVFARSGIQVGVHAALLESAAVPGRWWLQTYDRGYVAYEWAALVFYGARFGIWPN